MNPIIFGECIGACEKAMVRISALADQGCELETDVPTAIFDDDFALWIGAIGPIAATATRQRSGNLAVRFKEPVDARILQHFNAASQPFDETVDGT